MKNLFNVWKAKLLTLLVFGVAILHFCKKDHVHPNVILPVSVAANDPYVIQPEPRDSAYFWTKEYYLWTELLPSFEVFRPRDLPDVFSVMSKVRSFQPLDRFSFVERKSDPVLRETDLVVDMGFSIKYYIHTDDLRVSFVNVDSPAGLAGVKRGWRILSIDNRPISGGTQAEIAFLNDVFWGTTPVHLFRFVKPDGSTTNLTIREGVYRSHTVLFHHVYENNAQKIGYLVYNSFGGASSVNELQQVISSFENAGINDLIVDLRYNRGGFVASSEAFANLLAPQGLGTGRYIMFRYVFNSRHPEMNQSIYFNKTNTLNLSRIVFIVTPSTASASELLINSLTPVMQVRLIGDRHTYGKPVGFFPISVYEYNIYPVSFKTVNSVGRADYYQGFDVDKQVSDDLSHEFGDPEEAELGEALTYLTTGSFSARADEHFMALSNSLINEGNNGLKLRPAVAIENRKEHIPTLKIH
ncbi:MAG: S41 family peptidase [Sphingobacteriaceae bacterium]